MKSRSVRLPASLRAHWPALSFFLIALVYFVCHIPQNLTDYTEPWTYYYYIPDYATMGFAPRVLLGSVVALFTHFVTEKLVLRISIAATLLLIVLAAVLLDKVCTFWPEGRFALPYFFLLLLIVPNDSFYFLTADTIGIVDIYLLMLTFVCIRFADNAVMRWSIPLLCFVCMAMYEGYIFAYFPVLCIILLHKALDEKKKSAVLVLLLTLLSAAGSFIYFIFIFRLYRESILHIPDAELLVRALSQKTDLEISEIFDDLYFSNIAAGYDSSYLPEGLNAARKMHLLQSLPSAIVFLSTTALLWLHASRHTTNRRLRLLYILCAASPLAGIPFLTFSQQNKYISYLLLNQMMLLCRFGRREVSLRETVSQLLRQAMDDPILPAVPFALVLFLRVAFSFLY